ncbi:MAG: DUF4013 domain-containing protein [Euryarchaeota archaeon]|nr:DUF4013 domain-containing protein [Euryarchaeota archaeon]MBU4607090.1 DUF4013 domain-containing protein [Euryarchaeota archaeon]MBV1730536.1 DUF4013 domain-containing protein [Methanobacterium sp.]MBV1755519.1 DUF4013 domain-containing protein [Methanobacterium sp.]
MDIGEIYSDAIQYPSSDWKKVIILGIITILSILIVPIFLVMGYVFRALKASIAGSEELPEFDEWGDMLVDGLKVFLVGFVYFLIPAIILFIGIGGSIFAMTPTGDPTTFFALFGATALIAAIVAFILGLMLYIALANMAYYDSDLGAAFRFSEILEIISQIGWVDYILWYIVLVVVGAVGGFIVSILNFIPILGTIVAALVVYPYLSLINSRALALIYAFE